jgi:hypothetical protein
MNIDGEAAWLFYFTLGNFNLRVGISPTRPEMSELLFEDPKDSVTSAVGFQNGGRNHSYLVLILYSP